MNDRINSNLIDANIKLQDENNMLKIDNKMLETRLKKAADKLQSMFDNGNEETVLDDLLELDKILKGEVIYD